MKISPTILTTAFNIFCTGIFCAGLFTAFGTTGCCSIAQTQAQPLNNILDPTNQVITAQENDYVAARQLQKSGNTQDLQKAIDLYTEAAHNPALQERCQWHIAECAVSLGQENKARKALEAIKEKSTDDLTRAACDYALAQSYMRTNESDKAKEKFTFIRINYPHTQFALGAEYYLAEQLCMVKDTREESIALFHHYLTSSPDGHFAPTIIDRLKHLPDYEPTVDDQDLFGQVYFAQKNWQQAIDAWPLASLHKHWFEKAICLLNLQQIARAREFLVLGIRTHPDDPLLPEAVTSLCRMLSKSDANKTWHVVLNTSSKYRCLALANLARRADPAKALAYYRTICQQYPHCDFAPEASWGLFWDLVKRGKISQALEQGKKSLVLYPESKPAPRFAFWCGKLYEHLKKRALAKTAYQYVITHYGASYYGHRARARLLYLSDRKDPGWTTYPDRKHPDPQWQCPAPPALISWEEITNEYSATICELAKIAQWQECLGCLQEYSEIMPKPKNRHRHIMPVFKSFLLFQLDAPMEAINTANKELSESSSHIYCPNKFYPSQFYPWQLSYPLLYGNLIASNAKAKSVDPLLVHALIREESRYKATALSSSKAIGLMQLLPGTACGVAKRLAVPIKNINDIYIPENNIKLGTDYLALSLKRAGGNALFAVAGYNGGPNAVHSWVHRFKYGGLGGLYDWDFFVETIPYQETRDYVRKVFASFWNYEDIYGAKEI